MIDAEKAGLAPAFSLAVVVGVYGNLMFGVQVMKQNIAAVIIAVLYSPNMACAETAALKTQTGKDIGLSVSAYQYREPGIMSLTGAKIGLDLHLTKVLRNDQFIRGDLRYAFGTVDYNSSDTGSASGEPDMYFEIRGLFGKDWIVKEAVLSAYAGLGYRYLFNDGRGVTNTGYGGYRRESNYIYLPVGIIHRRELTGQARLRSTLEYDQLLSGTQISTLSDVPGYSDATNSQSSGYGLKLSIMYQKSIWAVGPYLNYWNIAESDVVPEIKNGVPTGYGLVEPKNNTIEIGLMASQQF
jgi:hypothetical protein